MSNRIKLSIEPRSSSGQRDIHLVAKNGRRFYTSELILSHNESIHTVITKEGVISLEDGDEIITPEHVVIVKVEKSDCNALLFQQKRSPSESLSHYWNNNTTDINESQTWCGSGVIPQRQRAHIDDPLDFLVNQKESVNFNDNNTLYQALDHLSVIDEEKITSGFSEGNGDFNLSSMSSVSPPHNANKMEKKPLKITHFPKTVYEQKLLNQPHLSDLSTKRTFRESLKKKLFGF
jgi:hypothetical protein